MQFAHARLASILLKAQDELHIDVTALKASPEKVSVEHESERALAFELLMFSDVIEVRSQTTLVLPSQPTRCFVRAAGFTACVLLCYSDAAIVGGASIDVTRRPTRAYSCV